MEQTARQTKSYYFFDETIYLRKSNSLNLNGNTLGQFLNCNTAASRLVREVLLVHAVHLSEVLHVGQENGGLQILSVSTTWQLDMAGILP